MNPVRSAALVVGLVLAVLVAVFATREAGQDRMTTHLVGAVAPPVSGSTLDGDHWDLDDQRGRWVLVTSSPPPASVAWRSTPSWWPSRGSTTGLIPQYQRSGW